MFGKKHELVGVQIGYEHEQASCHHANKIITQDLRSKHETANSKQMALKEKCKTKYDMEHDPVEFQVGDNVLARKMGRLGKFSQRDEGQFIVSDSKSNDIYILKSESTNTKIERHVKDMRPYNPLCAIIFLSGFAESLVFERAPPVLWTETDQFVSPGYRSVKLRIYFVSPCPTLQQLSHFLQEANTAASKCEEIFRDNIIYRLQQFNPIGPRPQVIVAAPPQAAPAPIPPMIPQYPNHPGSGQFPHKFMHPSNQDAMSARAEIERSKRDLGLGTFLTKSCVSCVLETVVDRVWPNKAVQELRDREKHIQESLNNLVAQLNVTQLNLMATQDAFANQAILISYNAAEIDDIRYNHPQLMVTSAHVTAKIVAYRADLERLQISIRRKKLDIDLLAMMALDNLDPDTITPSSINAEYIQPSALDISFVARIKDPSTKVYSVEAFSFWNNLTEEKASLMEYKGPSFLIYNASNHCVKGIALSKNHWVNARCDAMNFEDQQLSHWEVRATAEDPWAQPAHTTAKESWPFVFIYCWPKQITWRGETGDCPPYIMRINATEPFNTTDYVYSPSAIEIISRIEMVTTDVHSIHLRNQSHSLGENTAIKKVAELRKELTKSRNKLYALEF